MSNSNKEKEVDKENGKPSEDLYLDSFKEFLDKCPELKNHDVALRFAQTIIQLSESKESHKKVSNIFVNALVKAKNKDVEKDKKKNIKRKKRCRTFKYCFIKCVGNHWLIGLAILLLAISIALNIDHSTIAKESIVLGFVGVLATFIVVGNYAQVKAIESQSDNRIKEIEDKFKELEGIFNQLNEISHSYSDIAEKGKNKL